MKKIICFLLCLSTVLTFSACKKDKDTDKNFVDLEYYAKLGKIEGCDFNLGVDPSVIKNKMSAQSKDGGSEDGEKYYEETEGELSVKIDTGDYLYYYEKEKKDKGISYIVSLTDAYGFEIGAVTIEVKNALSKYKCEEIELNSDEIFFISGLSDPTVYKYTFNNVVVLFVFSENSLCATAMYDKNNWTI